MNSAQVLASDPLLTDGWVPVAGFPGYSVNTLGQVVKDSTGRVLHTRQNQFGVPYVGLMRDGRQCIRSLALLVAKVFVPGKTDEFDTPINLDGDRTNCRVDNIMWRPRLYAIHYSDQFEEQPYEHHIPEPIRDAETDESYPNSLDAACKNGLLEREVVGSILHNTYAWPTYQKFVIDI